MRRPLRVLLVPLLLAATTLGLTGTAAAATVAHTSATVTEGKVFAPWGDDRDYQPLPGGTDATVERYDRTLGTTIGWTFRNAGFAPGGTPWDVWRTTEKSVVSLPRYGSLASLGSWSDYVEDIRFFYYAPRRNAILDLQIYAYDTRGGRIDFVFHRLYAPKAGWNLSPALTVDSVGRTGSWRVDLNFFALEAGFLLDDVSIDPWRSRAP